MSTFGSVLNTTLQAFNAINLASIAFQGTSTQLAEAQSDVAVAQRDLNDALASGDPKKIADATEKYNTALNRLKELQDQVSQQKFQNFITGAASIALVGTSIVQTLPKLLAFSRTLSTMSFAGLAASMTGLGAATPAFLGLLGAGGALLGTFAAIIAALALIGYMATREGNQVADAMALMTDAIHNALGPGVLAPMMNAWSNFWTDVEYNAMESTKAIQIFGASLMDALNPTLLGGESALTKQLKGQLENIKAVHQQTIESNNAFYKARASPEGIKLSKMESKMLIDQSNTAFFGPGSGLSEFQPKEPTSPVSEAIAESEKAMTDIEKYHKEQMARQYAIIMSGMPTDPKANTVGQDLGSIMKLFGLGQADQQVTIPGFEVGPQMAGLDENALKEQAAKDAAAIEQYIATVTKAMENADLTEIQQKLVIVGGPSSGLANVKIQVDTKAVEAAKIEIAGLQKQLSTLGGGLSEKTLRVRGGGDILAIITELDAAKQKLAELEKGSVVIQPKIDNSRLTTELAGANSMITQGADVASSAYGSSWQASFGEIKAGYTDFAAGIGTTTQALALEVENRVRMMASTIVASVDRALKALSKLQSKGGSSSAVIKSALASPTAASSAFKPSTSSPIAKPSNPQQQMTSTISAMQNSAPGTAAYLTQLAKQAGVIPAAEGYQGMVSKPTMFLAGEAGKEYVSITPANQMGAQAGEVYGSAATTERGDVTIINHNNYNIEGSIWAERELFNKLEGRGTDDLRRRNVNGHV